MIDQVLNGPCIRAEATNGAVAVALPADPTIGVGPVRTCQEPAWPRTYMSTERVLIWDFDGTLGHRPGMLSQVLADVVQAACPGLACTRDHVRPFLRDGFPWHRPQHPHTHITTAEIW